MTSSEWPHALDAIMAAGKRRRKQYFPECLPGLFTLSKTEVADDIDLIEFEAERASPARQGAHPRRRAYRSQEQAQTQTAADAEGNATAPDRPSKRAKLMERILSRSSELSKAKLRLTELREVLDTLNAEIAHCHDSCARMQRQNDIVEKEKKSLEDNFRSREDEYRISMQALEKSRQVLESRLKESGDRLSELTSHVDTFKMLDERVVGKDKRIRDLELELAVVKKQMQLLQDRSTPAVSAPPAPGSAAGTDAAKMQFGPPVNAHLNAPLPPDVLELRTLKERLSEALTNAVCFERKKVELEAMLNFSEEKLQEAKKENIKEAAESRAKDKKLSDMEQVMARLRVENSNIKKLNEQLSLDVSLASERLESHDRIVEASDQRVLEAERILVEHSRDAAVLRNGNMVLQAKYNALYETSSRLIVEKDECSRKLEHANARASELAAGALKHPSAVEAQNEGEIEKKLKMQVEMLQMQLDKLRERFGSEMVVQDVSKLQSGSEATEQKAHLKAVDMSQNTNNEAVAHDDEKASGNTSSGPRRRSSQTS